MKHLRLFTPGSQQRLRRVLAGLALVCLWIPRPAPASGVVNNCTEADLRAALAGGGAVTFACDGTITLANTLTIAANTTIDASGRNISLDGGFTNRVLTVQTGVVCAVTNVRVINGWCLPKDTLVCIYNSSPDLFN